MMITPEQLKKLREGRCTPDELVAWRAYFQQADLSALDKLLTDDWQNPIAGPTAETANAQRRVWQRLQEKVAGEAVPIRPLASRLGWQWAVAASVAGLLLAGTGWFVWQRQTQSEPMAGFDNRAETNGWLVTTNQTDALKNLTLTDGSTISLQPKSRVRYPARFTGTLRTVQLAGEAFFAVRPDKAHPFVVQTQSVRVRVLGTSFTVHDFTGQPAAEVTVKTGRVSVSPANGKTGIMLIPNERATLTVANGQLAKALVPQPELVNPKAVVNQFVFADTPVSEVFGVLERSYGVTIQVDPQTLANCTLTARLTEQPLFTKLDMICASIGASYRVEGTLIIVQSAGCD
ncbi:MAG: FecR domain-containing protein [Bacteroidetes bacterium]|nr:FecR domain-containing protein [Fibrella sp.]